ncbi:MAG: diacylglycerol kinase family protein [Chloroflexota bacterium]
MPPRHPVKLIVNPNADLGRAWHAAADLRPIVEEFGGADWAGTVYPTHAVELARQAAEEGYELVIAAGGDGTAHEVVNGLMQVPKERRPRLGVVPIGSGNDFSHAVGMDPRPPYALRQIFTGKPRSIDIGLLKDDHNRQEYWVNAVGIGFDTTVTIRSRRITLLRGFLIYLVAVVQTILFNHDAPLMQVNTDLESWEQNMIMLVLCNGPREGGGFHIQPEARPDDGIFHYAGVEKVSRPMMFRLLPEVMNGTHARFKQVRMGQFHRLDLKADRPLYVHTDGEILAGFGMDLRSLSVEILPGEIEMVG